MPNVSIVITLTLVTLAVFAVVAVAENVENAYCGPDTVNAASSVQSQGSEPLVCSLGSKEKRDRRDGLGTLLKDAISQSTELEDGYQLTLKKGYTKRIVEYIELERECCPFFEFALTYASNDGPITLSVTGPEGSKAFSSALFGAMAETSSPGKSEETKDACCAVKK